MDGDFSQPTDEIGMTWPGLSPHLQLKLEYLGSGGCPAASGVSVLMRSLLALSSGCAVAPRIILFKIIHTFQAELIKISYIIKDSV